MRDTHFDTNATGHGLGLTATPGPRLRLGLRTALRFSDDVTLFVDDDDDDGDDGDDDNDAVACSKASPIVR